MIRYFTLLLLTLSFCACQDDIVAVESSDLIGEWRSENSMINDRPASEFLGTSYYSSILGLKETGFYFLNYSSGNWTLEENILNLDNRGAHEIISFSDSIMTIRVELTAGELYWALNGIDADETIVLQEDYRRR